MEDKFNIYKSALFKIVRRVSCFLSNLSSKLINWSTKIKKLDAEHFFRLNSFPGAIETIDGAHIRINQPLDD